MTYRQGDYLFICDKCGVKRLASTGRVQWDGLFVCPGCYDERNPQDFVKGIPDDQSVPIARPDITPSTGETTVKTTAERNATSIALTSVSNISDNDPIGIVMDNGAAHYTFVDGAPVGDTVTLGSYLPHRSASGNEVYLLNINNETYITATEITATGL